MFIRQVHINGESSYSLLHPRPSLQVMTHSESLLFLPGGNDRRRLYVCFGPSAP